MKTYQLAAILSLFVAITGVVAAQLAPVAANRTVIERGEIQESFEFKENDVVPFRPSGPETIADLRRQ